MNAAKWLLVAIVIVAIALAGFIFYQSQNKITVRSLIPEVSATLNNKKYLESKLNEVGFWKKDNVSFYKGAFVNKVTVKKLDIRLVDQPQLWGKLVDDANAATPKIYRSFGVQYNPVSQTLFILLHVDRGEDSPGVINRKYSAELLTAIFDLTHRVGETGNKQRLEGLYPFLDDYMKGKIDDGEVIIQTQ